MALFPMLLSGAALNAGLPLATGMLQNWTVGGATTTDGVVAGSGNVTAPGLSGNVGITADGDMPWPESANGANAAHVIGRMPFITPPVRVRDCNPKMACGLSWRQIGAGPSLLPMLFPYPRPSVGFIRMMLLATCILLVPGAAHAQDHWTGIGAINGTVMFMDTTTIVRDGTIRRVWVKSLDTSPKTFVAGKDTVTFDTVIGLNVFDCARGTRTVMSVRYLLGDDVVFTVPTTHDAPEPVRKTSFFGAIYSDVCRSPR